eukprot:364852-Chlamydomonas_euryale.AAC.14
MPSAFDPSESKTLELSGGGSGVCHLVVRKLLQFHSIVYARGLFCHGSVPDALPEPAVRLQAQPLRMLIQHEKGRVLPWAGAWLSFHVTAIVYLKFTLKSAAAAVHGSAVAGCSCVQLQASSDWTCASPTAAVLRHRSTCTIAIDSMHENSLGPSSVQVFRKQAGCKCVGLHGILSCMNRPPFIHSCPPLICEACSLVMRTCFRTGDVLQLTCIQVKCYTNGHVPHASASDLTLVRAPLKSSHQTGPSYLSALRLCQLPTMYRLDQCFNTRTHEYMLQEYVLAAVWIPAI